MFLFPLSSCIVPASITIFVTPFILLKLPSVNLYPTNFRLSTSANFCFVAKVFNIDVSVICVNCFVIELSRLSSTYTLILSSVNEFEL